MWNLVDTFFCQLSIFKYAFMDSEQFVAECMPKFTASLYVKLWLMKFQQKDNYQLPIKVL